MRAARGAALTAYGGLVMLILLWEAWLAPVAVTPRVFWVIVKLGPLALPVYGLLWTAGANAYVVAALIALLYLVEGVVLAFSAWRGFEGSGVLAYALLEMLLASTFFVSAAWYVRLKGRAM